MNGYRKYMIDNGGNLDWCKPLTHDDITIAVSNGDVVSIMVNGEDIDAPEIDHTVSDLARKLNTAYGEYKGWSDTHILLDAVDWEEDSCCNCPWFGICDAMENPDDWDEYHPEYPDDAE